MRKLLACWVSGCGAATAVASRNDQSHIPRPNVTSTATDLCLSTRAALNMGKRGRSSAAATILPSGVPTTRLILTARLNATSGRRSGDWLHTWRCWRRLTQHDSPTSGVINWRNYLKPTRLRSGSLFAMGAALAEAAASSSVCRPPPAESAGNPPGSSPAPSETPTQEHGWPQGVFSAIMVTSTDLSAAKLRFHG